MTVVKSIFYNPSYVCSRNAFINFIIGGRGVGKTMNCKRFCIDDFIKNGRQFFYIRRYNTELEIAFEGFFEQLQHEGYYTDREFKILKFKKNLWKFTMDGDIIGFACALTTSLIAKSASFPDVYNLIFDEVLLARGTSYHYLKNEVVLFLELLESIFRLRGGRCFLLANAVSVANPYFDYWNIKLKKDKNFERYQDGLICVELVDNKDFTEIKRKSVLGRLINGTRYGEYAIDNKMLQDSGSFIAWKPSGSRIVGTVIVDGKKLGLWSDYRSGCLYICGVYNPNSTDVIAFSTSDHSEGTVLAWHSNPLFEQLKTAFQFGCLYFENESVKKSVLQFVIGGVD